MDLTLKINLECFWCRIGSDVNCWHISAFIRLSDGGYIINQVAVLGSQLLIPLYGLIISVLFSRWYRTQNISIELYVHLLTYIILKPFLFYAGSAFFKFPNQFLHTVMLCDPSSFSHLTSSRVTLMSRRDLPFTADQISNPGCSKIAW